jgi:hypothetical protein
MPEVWVTPLSCSECRRYHSEDGDGGECDCWCHDRDMDLEDYGDFEYG